MEELKNKKILSWLAVFVWLVVIFMLSAMRGSGENSYSLFYFIERKSFHVIEYFILAGLCYQALTLSFSMKKALSVAAVFSFAYAAIDEWHQTFVFGREGTLRDVAIDLIGIILAVIFIIKFKKWKKAKKQLN